MSTKSLGDHIIIWVPTKFCALPCNRVDTQRQRFLDVHTICMVAHEVLWACTHDMWTAKSRLFWVSTHISWTANNGKTWAPKHVANITHFGRPGRYGWSPMLLRWPSTLRIGRPREFVDAHVRSWTSKTRLLLDTHVTKHGRPSCVNGRQ